MDDMNKKQLDEIRQTVQTMLTEINRYFEPLQQYEYGRDTRLETIHSCAKLAERQIRSAKYNGMRAIILGLSDFRMSLARRIEHDAGDRYTVWIGNETSEDLFIEFFSESLLWHGFSSTGDFELVVKNEDGHCLSSGEIARCIAEVICSDV